MEIEASISNYEYYDRIASKVQILILLRDDTNKYSI